jgi:hypothetical protein
MNNIKKITIFMLLVVAVFACKEGERYGISSEDKIPPSAPVLDSVQPLPGGVRLFYQIIDEEDVLGIEASFTATNGKLVKSAASFIAPYLDVFGLGDTLEHTIQLYTLDRAGNKSENVNVTFTPLEPAFSKVAKSLTVKPAFGSLLIDWENELQQNLTVFVDFTYSDNGTRRSLRQAYSSRASVERYFIKDLNLPESEAVSVKVTVEDFYGNQSGLIDKGDIHLLVDEKLDKSKFVIPSPGDKIGNAIMGYGSSAVGRIEAVFDDIIDFVAPYGVRDNLAWFGYQHWVMIDGVNRDVNVANNGHWDILIDLGGYYELSRINTVQNWWDGDVNSKSTDICRYYGSINVGKYDIYYWEGDDEGKIGEWKLINNVTIPLPTSDMSILDRIKAGRSGDEFLMYPDDPHYTPPTRYFRYESISGFPNADAVGTAISELTLFGRKARQ